LRASEARSAVTATAKPATPGSSLVLRCFACGMQRQVDDDGRRVRLAKVHVAACTQGPGPKAESHLSLVSGDRLEVTLANGSVWFEISRGELGEAPLSPQETVARFYREWHLSVVNGPEAYAAAFGTNAALMPPDAAPVIGREAIRAWREGQAQAPFRVLPESAVQDEIRVEGQAAYVRTTVRGTRVPRAGGDAVPFAEKYLDLLRRTDDGSWEFVARMWNNSQ
jgi:ketosteroid isomerase-like protein